MTESYYPKHSRDHLDVIRDWPVPAHDIPRLTREVEGLRRDLDAARALLADVAGLLEPHALKVPGLPAIITRIHMKLDEP
jgi:hypothetical protein